MSFKTGCGEPSNFAALFDSIDPQPVTPEVEQAARIVVCSKATDADDAATLLKMLGLI